MRSQPTVSVVTLFFAGFVGGLWGLWGLHAPPPRPDLQPFDPFDYAPTLHPLLVAGVQLLGVLLVMCRHSGGETPVATPSWSYLEDAI